jgi:hypothetical protein
MIVAAGQSIGPRFTTQDLTGQNVDATGTPTGVLYVNGTANAASVTITDVGTGVYKAAFTVPTDLSDRDALELLISATVDGVSQTRKVWSAAVFSSAPPVSLTIGSVLPRVWSQDIEAFIGEEGEHTLVATNNRGAAENLSGIASLSVVIATKGTSPAVIQTIPNASLDRTDDADGIIRFTNNAAVTESVRTLRYTLKNAAGNVRVMRGDFKVSYEP